MTRGARFAVAAVGVSLTLWFTACGDDDALTASADAAAENDSASDAAPDDATGGEGDSTGGAGGGVLVIDGETIELGTGRCYLEPQESAGGGGSILATAQGSGTNADGQSLIVDFTRYDEESMFHGDDVHIDSTDGSFALKASLPEGDVDVTDAEVSAESIEMTDPEEIGGDAVTVSFSIGC